MVNIPSPAIAVVGRHNSGKTTLVVKLIEELVARGHDVGSIKHHHREGFEIDIPGKDSYRHRQAGASETVISCPGQVAMIKTLDGEAEANELVRRMPNHDIVVVEGYRKSGLPTIEIMRSGNDADTLTAHVLAEGVRRGWPLGADFTQIVRELRFLETEEERQEVLNRRGEQIVQESLAAIADRDSKLARAHALARKPIRDYVASERSMLDLSTKVPTGNTVAIVTDIPEAVEAAKAYNIPAFNLDDVSGVATFLEQHYVRPRVSLVIQAGGESRRMGQSKATVPFAGKPLICRLVRRLHPAANELIITTNEADRLGFLKDEFPNLNIRLVPDTYDFRGALPGLYTALSAATCPYVAVVACDMVNASASLVVSESITMHQTGTDVVVPVNKNGFEPFHAMYRRETCLEAVRQTVEEGERRAQSFFDKVDVYEFTQEEVNDAVPFGGCFQNCNTPAELKALEEAVTD